MKRLTTNPAIVRYGLAMALSLAALLATTLLTPLIDLYTLLLFLLAVMASAFYGGWAPGLLATLLSGLAIALFFVPPANSVPSGLTDALRVGLFCLVALATIWLIEGSRRAQVRLGKSERRARSLFDSTFQFVGLMRPDGTLTEVNQTALDFGGLTRDDVIGKPFWECYWWTISSEAQEQLKEAIRRTAGGSLFATRPRCSGKIVPWRP